VASRSPVLRALLTRLAAGLDEADRKELAKSLGVPDSQVHDLLAKLRR
jgi:DNA-binding IclR family transcriptional regulator